MRIQPKRSFEALDALLARTTNPAHRAMLNNFRSHMRAEISCDIEAIMATMTAAPVYHSYGGPAEVGPKNREQTRDFYLGIFSGGSNVIELQVDRLSVDDWGIAGDGVMNIIYPGKGVSAMGFEIDDEDAHYLFRARQSFFLPYVDGLMDGEDTYIDWNGATVTKLAPSDVVTTEQAFA